MVKAPSIKKKEGFAGERACIFPITLKHELQRSSLCKNLYLTDIGFYPKALHHARERTQGCDQFILIYCVHGSGWFSVKGKNYDVTPNHFFILPKNIGHRYGSDPKDPWTIYWVHFTGHLAEEYFHYLSGRRSLKPRIVFPSEERNQLFDEIIHYASMINNKDSVIFANNCLYNYLASFKNTIFSQSDTDRHQNNIIDDCLQLMKENLDKNINLYEISQLMGLSTSYLSSLFKAKMNDSPYNYFVFLKIQRACYLLWNSNEKIKNIALQLGYDDPYHFSRVFKHTMGLSPRQFRNRDK